MVAGSSHPQVVHRTARICLRTTPAQAKRCYQLLRAAGDVWAWLLDSNRDRRQQGDPAVVGYQALCRQLTNRGGFGELSVVGARSVLQRYSDAWFEAARRQNRGERAGFPRRKRFLVPIRFYNGTFLLDGDRRVRLPIAKGHPELWVRLARPLPYLPDQVRSVTLLHDAGRLWLSVTAAVPVEQHDLDPDQVSGVDLGIIHPYAVVTEDAGLLVSGRAVRADSYLHLKDQQARQSRAVGRAPKAGQRGSRRWRRYRRAQRRAEARHRRRVHQAHHQAARQVIAFAIAHRVGTLVVGDPTGITGRDAGRVQNWRLRQWRRTHLLGALCDRPSRPGSKCTWWRSGGRPRPARPAANASPSHAGAGSAVRTADSKGIVISWVPQTSPPSSAADIPARRSPRWSSTVGSGWCRPGVTAAVICMTGGGGPA
jgi:transposase